jgi:hypothetical protein
MDKLAKGGLGGELEERSAVCKFKQDPDILHEGNQVSWIRCAWVLHDKNFRA